MFLWRPAVFYAAELQAVINFLTWVLGIQIRSSVRTLCPSTHQVIPLAPWVQVLCDKLTMGASSIYFFSCKIILIALPLKILAIRVWSQWHSVLEFIFCLSTSLLKCPLLPLLLDLPSYSVELADFSFKLGKKTFVNYIVE